MLLLDTTTDKIQVITDSAATVDVVASYIDMTQADPPVVKGSTSGSLAVAISSATTTDVVAAPAAATTRNVKAMTIRNKHATLSVVVTVQLNLNGTLYELHKTTLAAGNMLEFIEGVGFFMLAPAAKLWKNLRAQSDVINATTSFADITGLTCSVESGKHYNFIACLFHIENASTTGAQFAINGPAMTAMRLHELGGFAGAVGAGTMQANVADVTTRDVAAIAATSSAATPQVIMAILSGWINPSAAGTFAVRFASEVAVAAGITVKAGSWCQIWEADA